MGYSGIKVRIIVGASASDIFYISIGDKPSLLLSDSLSGDFVECDIDQNEEKELIASFANYMYIKRSGDIYKASYDISENIRQILIEEDICLFNVIFNDGTQKKYQYDTNKEALTVCE